MLLHFHRPERKKLILHFFSSLNYFKSLHDQQIHDQEIYCPDTYHHGLFCV